MLINSCPAGKTAPPYTKQIFPASPGKNSCFPGGKAFPSESESASRSKSGRQKSERVSISRASPVRTWARPLAITRPSAVIVGSRAFCAWARAKAFAQKRSYFHSATKTRFKQDQFSTPRPASSGRPERGGTCSCTANRPQLPTRKSLGGDTLGVQCPPTFAVTQAYRSHPAS
jgi:hypothetical protein